MTGPTGISGPTGYTGYTGATGITGPMGGFNTYAFLYGPNGGTQSIPSGYSSSAALIFTGAYSFSNINITRRNNRDDNDTSRRFLRH